ncbi:MAG: MmcQ/YjbR family DNA-binding protein [Woeseiaceae bacterium]|nr:MmcQ/YjbR family DNA-binding protein [Woeseiaceae bacterium]
MNADQLGEVCLSLPAATVVVQWGDNRVYKIGGKMFAVSGPDAASLYSFKVDDYRFLELTDLPGVRPAPYLARAKWVQIDPPTCVLDDGEIEDLVRDSYELVFARLTKKLQRELRPED